MWTLWTTTASDSSSLSDLAVSVVLCGTAGSSSPCLLTDEESHTARKHGRTTARSSASLTTPFKPSTTDHFVVSGSLVICETQLVALVLVICAKL